MISIRDEFQMQDEENGKERSNIDVSLPEIKNLA